MGYYIYRQIGNIFGCILTVYNIFSSAYLKYFFLLNNKTELLTNPRTIAMQVHSGHDLYLNTYSNLLPHFAQFVDHDITLTSLISTLDGEPIKCSCEDHSNPDCINIPMPKEDRVNRDQKCMVTPRSSASFKRLDCKLGQREQLNMLTHWLDLSQTYGNDWEKSQRLRTFSQVVLKSDF